MESRGTQDVELQANTIRVLGDSLEQPNV